MDLMELNYDFCDRDRLFIGLLHFRVSRFNSAELLEDVQPHLLTGFDLSAVTHPQLPPGNQGTLRLPVVA